MLERVLKFAIDQRALVVLIALVIAGIGVESLLRLPIDAVPDITNNQVQVNTLAPSLSPIEIEKQVTFPIETTLAGVPGLEYTRSLSRSGFSQVTAVFREGVDIYFARQLVTERLGEAGESLPEGVRPALGPIATGLGEVFMWTVEYGHPRGVDAEIHESEPGWQSDGSYLTPEGERLTTEAQRAAYLRTVQDWIIRPQLKGVKDVAGIDAIGGYEKQYHVQPDPLLLISHHLTFHNLAEALERNNVSAGAGTIEHRGESYVVRADGRLTTAEALSQVVVGEDRGRTIRVADVATVALGQELRTGSASENGEEVVVGTALMLIGANSRTVAHAVDVKLQEVARSLPSDIVAKPVLNRTKLVDATIHTVRQNLLEGALLVIVVLFLLLGNVRAAVITALAIPFAMLMTATGMVRLGISGNLMSLGAIDFGLIVDGAVIIVENCLRRLAERQAHLGRPLALAERLQEVQRATKEMIQPSVAGQLIIITVYLPLLTLSGIEGKMFQPMALTVILALVAAFILSLTLVPALVALLITGKVSEHENPLIRAAKRAYAPMLRLALRFRVAVAGLAALAFAASLLLFGQLGQEFIPTLDEQDIAVQALRIPSTGLEQSTIMQLDVERAIAESPEVAFVFSKTGTAEVATDPMPPNISDTFIILKPRDQWPDPELPKDALLDRFRADLAQLPGQAYEFTQPIQMRFNELIGGVRGDVAVKVYGDEFETVAPVANQIAAVLKEIPGATDVKVEQLSGLPSLSLEVHREVIARYGLSVADVQEVVSMAVGGHEAGQLFQGDRRFDIVIRLPETLRTNLRELERLPVPLPESEEFVPLDTLADLTPSEGLNQISRENGKRRLVVQANVRGRDIGSFVEEAQRRIEAEVQLPAGSWLDWGGQFENLMAARERLALVVPACFLLIFLLLYSTFGSARQALIIFSGVPLALTGGIVALWLRGMPFSISAAVGFIALSGVAVLNGLVLVSAINQLRREHLPLDQAITQGALLRLRPVLMTALVASLGFVPMALAHGTGAEVQRPLATVVIGGLVTATALTLVVLPALYRMFEREDRRAPRDTPTT